MSNNNSDARLSKQHWFIWFLLPAQTSTTAIKRAISSDSRPRELSLELNSNMASSKEPMPRPLRVSSGYVCPFKNVTVLSLWLNSEQNLTISTCKRQHDQMEVLSQNTFVICRLMSLRVLTLMLSTDCSVCFEWSDMSNCGLTNYVSLSSADWEICLV